MTEIIFGERDINTNDAIVVSIVILLSITTGISIALFSPVWFLMDSGIIYSNKDKLEKKKLPSEVRGVGSWYLYLLKGYAGISVLFSFYSIITVYISQESTNYAGIIFFLVLPITVALFMIPAIIVLDILTEHRKNYMLNFAKKFGIVKDVQVKFEVIEK